MGLLDIKPGSRRLRMCSHEKSLCRSATEMIPFSVAGSKRTQLRTCSSDRKKFMVLQAKLISSYHLQKGTATYPTIPSGSIFNISPSRISTRIGTPQCMQTVSIRTVFPGKSQLTASDSKAHWPNHFCSPSTVMGYWLGKLLKGARETMRSVLGKTQPGINSEKRA